VNSDKPQPKKSDIDVKFAAYGTVCKIDGVHVPCVREVQVIHRAGDCPKVLLEIVPQGSVQIMGDAFVRYSTRPIYDATATLFGQIRQALYCQWRKVVPFVPPPRFKPEPPKNQGVKTSV
jgi:hypothetical protein